jgi:LmbE family N-acetylglucosaminyl deacetylase
VEQLASVVRWLGAGGGERLSGSVAVLSPHLDDGVFSLGAAVAAARGSEVAVVTVFAGDPESEQPAGAWDTRAGFRTAGEAARRRRREDELACADIGAQPVWLPFSDHQYPRRGDESTIWSAIEEAIGEAETVFVPGFPLKHEDHAWLCGLVGERGLQGRRVAHYVEQPYAAAWTSATPPGRWSPLMAALPHRLAKLKACRRYASQLPLLAGDRRLLLLLTRYEAAHGGECVRADLTEPRTI